MHREGEFVHGQIPQMQVVQTQHTLDLQQLLLHAVEV